MRSRAARLISGAVAWLAILGAAYFLFTSEQQLTARRTALRAFDQHAREAAEALADVRASQQAYVAAGQGVAFWMPKVSALLEQTAATVDTLRSSATSAAARQQLVDVTTALTELGNVDRRARDYIRSGEMLMAGDVVFTEGDDVASGAAHRVEESRLAEYRAYDAEEAEQRRLEALALGGAAGIGALVVALLAFARAPRAVQPAASAAAKASAAPVSQKSSSALVTPASNASPASVQALRAAAVLCTEFGCVKEVADVAELLGRAATLMDASGLIVWLGSLDGGDLQPVLSHGYPEQTLARILPVPRTADNAAAAAYRTGSLQVVAAHPGVSSGALVAPMLVAEGCIGALTAEIRDRGETSDSVQALAAILAAQLAGVLSPSVAAGDGRNAESGRAAMA